MYFVVGDDWVEVGIEKDVGDDLDVIYGVLIVFCVWVMGMGV